MTDLDVYRYKLLSDTYSFTRFFYKEVNKCKFIRNWHFDLMSKKLDQVLEGTHPTNNLIFNLPPRHTKTLMAMIMFAAKGFAINPKSQFIHLSASDNLISRNVSQIRDVMLCEMYKELFPNTVITNNAKSGIETSAGGVMYAAPFLGQVTGFGCGILGSETFSGAMLIDDPMKTQDALSATTREKVNFAWANTFKSRKNDIRTPVIVTAQRVHSDDFCGFLIKEEGTIEEGGVWDVVKIPAITDYGTENEKALWEERVSLEELKRLEKLDKWVFETQYMQNPKQIEGTMFPENETKYFEIIPEEPDYVFIQVDPADMGGDCYSSKVYYIKDMEVFLVDCIYTTDNVDIVMPRQIEQIRKYKPSRVNMESNSAWRLVSRDVKQKVGELGLSCDVVRHNATQNKEARIFNEAPTIRNHFHYLAPSMQSDEYRKMMNERHNYLKMVKNQRDDGVDTDAAASAFLKRMGLIEIV